MLVNPKDITVTVSPNQTKVYGESDPIFGYTYEPSLIAGDIFTGELSRVSGEDVFSYTIEQSTLALSSNYNLNFVADNFTITQKELIITAQDNNRDYGQVNPQLVFTFNGFIVGEDQNVLDELPSISCSATISDLAGTYPIQLTGGSDNNYFYNRIDGTLTVNAILGTVGTLDVTQITSTSALLSGDLMSHGGNLEAEKGFVIGFAPSPTLDDFQVINGTGEGAYSEQVEGFGPNTTYYVRTYVTNTAGTAYGNEKEFTTLLSSVSNIDNVNASAYPNPFSDFVNLKNVEINSTVEIYTLNGILLQTVIVTSQNQQLNLSKIAAGVYMLNIISNKGTTHIKLIKQ